MAEAAVADVLAIQSLKALYCEGADLLPIDAVRAAEALMAVFTADATADYGAGLLKGRDAIIGFLVDGISPVRSWLWHAIHTPFVAVDGDSAEARWTIVAMMKDKGSDVIERAYGRYADRLVRTPQGWRIASMRWIEEARS
ncbi:nuclear transport factor 2 family protein [Rhizorhabdus dicambivorans]|nr:nuclear transport factor 2 family protein [Rhizorhabdus dicambivorans]